MGYTIAVLHSSLKLSLIHALVEFMATSLRFDLPAIVRRMRFVCYLLLFVLFVSCKETPVYTIASSVEEPQNTIARLIAKIINENTSDSIRISSGFGSLSNLDSVSKGVIDLAIVDNYITQREGVRAIYPIYPQILHVLHKKGMGAESFKDLIAGRKVFAGSKGSGSYRLLLKLLQELNIRMNDFEMLPTSRLFDADVIFTFTDIIGYAELRDLEGYEFFSFDHPENLGSGTFVEGVCLRYPQLKPFVIPKNLYGEYNQKSILTLSSDAVLVCGKNLGDEFVYNLAKVLNENRQKLSAISPLLYEGLRDDVDLQRLSFPVHQGARNFFERNEPTFIERYAELGGVIFSVFVALGSGLYTLNRIREQKKKDHIDEYYDKLMKMRKKVAYIHTRKDANALIDRVKDIQEITLQLVIEEKLLANESFSIFLTLTQIVLQEIKERCSSLDIEL
jgi:TRAP-type uncharacterized transport system substrate-binding protein